MRQPTLRRYREVPRTHFPSDRSGDSRRFPCASTGTIHAPVRLPEVGRHERTTHRALQYAGELEYQPAVKIAGVHVETGGHKVVNRRPKCVCQYWHCDIASTPSRCFGFCHRMSPPVVCLIPVAIASNAPCHREPLARTARHAIAHDCQYWQLVPAVAVRLPAHPQSSTVHDCQYRQALTLVAQSCLRHRHRLPVLAPRLPRLPVRLRGFRAAG